MDSSDEQTFQARLENITASTLMGAQSAIGESVGEWYVERSKYTPLRLTMAERKLLRLLEAAVGRHALRLPISCSKSNRAVFLEVSEYTDRIGACSATLLSKFCLSDLGL